jgi:putative holliday junction resolvase
MSGARSGSSVGDAPPAVERLLGLDYGLRRVGVALGDTTLRLATPLTTLDARQGLLPALAALIVEHGVGRVVLGDPRRADGSPGTLHESIRRLGEAIARLGPRVVYWDEAHSSRQAATLLREADGRRGARGSAATRQERREGRLDRAAAALVLQDYLDHGEDSP